MEQIDSGSQDCKNFRNPLVENGGVVSSINRSKENVVGREMGGSETDQMQWYNWQSKKKDGVKILRFLA